MVKSLEVVAAMVVGSALLLAGALPAAAVDQVVLTNGDLLAGDLQEAEFTLRTPQATYRVTRATVGRVDLNRASGDWVQFRNGNQLVGLLDQGRYTLRLPGGQMRVLGRGEIATLTLGPTAAAPGQQPTDALILLNGDLVYGDLSGTEFDIIVPAGIQKFQRDTVWRIILNTAVGDSMQLANGDELSGIVDHPRYSIRTPDGQELTFGRDEVRVVVLRTPQRPAAAPAPPPTAVVTPAPAPVQPPPAPAPVPAPAPAPAPAPVQPPPVAAVPPPALPPPIRSALQDLHFQFDRWDLTPEARRTLDDLAAAMKAFPALSLTVEGHADERGTTEYNLALGARRAQAAKDYLVALGIDPGRLETVSLGEERPLDPGRNELAWALNRRVHFVVKSR